MGWAVRGKIGYGTEKEYRRYSFSIKGRENGRPPFRGTLPLFSHFPIDEGED